MCIAPLMAQNADAKILQARAEISLLNLCRAQLNFLQSYNFFRRWQRKCRFIFSSCMVTAQKLLSFYLLSFTFYLSPFILYLLPFILYLLPFILYLLPFIFYLLPYIFYLLSYIFYLSFTMGSKKKFDELHSKSIEPALSKHEDTRRRLHIPNQNYSLRVITARLRRGSL